MFEIKNLTCGYNSDFLLKDITFNVNKKELLGIIGPNGSGKTTLIKALTRLIKPLKGEVIFEGKNIWQITHKELSKKIAVVTQNLQPNFMNVEEFILLGRSPHYKKFQFLETKKDYEVVRKCMLQTDTIRLKDKFLNQISGGEKQLISIARALAQEPELLLLDEPTAHLDITHQIKILDLIRKLNKESGLTVIIVLHDLNLASEYCDRIILLNNGLIHKIGSPQEILTYQIIEEVYKTVVIVGNNPVSSKPYIFLVNEEDRKKSIRV